MSCPEPLIYLIWRGDFCFLAGVFLLLPGFLTGEEVSGSWMLCCLGDSAIMSTCSESEDSSCLTEMEVSVWGEIFCGVCEVFETSEFLGFLEFSEFVEFEFCFECVRSDLTTKESSLRVLDCCLRMSLLEGEGERECERDLDFERRERDLDLDCLGEFEFEFEFWR